MGAYGNDGTSPGGRSMLRPLQNVLAGKAPMSPSEITDLIQRPQVDERRVFVREGKCLCAYVVCAVLNPFQKLAVVSRPIGPEVL
jgi:hypothetical protein